MNIYESLVEQLLTRNGLGMVCPQFDIQTTEWHASVDFLAFDFVRTELAFVEVSTAYQPAALIEKAMRIRDDQGRIAAWLEKIPLTVTKPVRFIGFVWDARAAYKRTEKLTGADKSAVCFVGIRDIVNLGDHWEGRSRGLPIRNDDGVLKFPSAEETTPASP